MSSYCCVSPKHRTAYYQLLRIAIRRHEKDRVTQLAEIVRNIRDKEGGEAQEVSVGLTEESLRGSAAGVLVTKSAKYPQDVFVAVRPR